MARKTHLTDHRNVAIFFDIVELMRLEEGWLDNPNLVLAVDKYVVAIFYRRFLYLLNWPKASAPFAVRRNILYGFSSVEEEHVSVLEWLVFDDYRVIAMGTSRGYLLLFSVGFELLHKQLVYPGRILKLRVRQADRNIFLKDKSNEDLCVVIQPGIIARFDVSHIQKALQRMYQEDEYLFRYNCYASPDRSSKEYAIIPYQLWNVSKYGSCVDAALTTVSSFVRLRHSRDRCYCAVTIGADATISAFRLSEDQSMSFVEVILSKVVPATVSTIASFSRLLWRTQQPTKIPESEPPPFGRALPLACLKDHLSTGDKLIQSLGGETWFTTEDFLFRHEIDNPIKGGKLTLSPAGTLAAITDSLGRIMLLDTRTLVVVRMWNGYRDASCLFVERLVNKNSQGRVKSDYCLCLGIHAPRKCIIEIWRMRMGPRILRVPCPKGSKILQPTYRFGSTFSASSSTCYEPLQVFVFNGNSGQLSRLN
ncbi:hypothetical protein M8C21_012705 [Ambrosia artemisiifolia]|uniref:Rab3-GAP regulatory subunit N-terminal domain-containing protein n=1 Tax=Ambrosia artemisiifolia TaxID=4212 RepID=A0AAD5C175_AMBAR|nr:hypothetical protein M8C21_012705 [Ambrosia artemisiifolia]